MNTNRTNKFAGNCTCGTRVAAGAGVLGPKVAGRWTTRCWGCVTAGNVAKARSAQWVARPAAARACDCGRPRCGGCDDTFEARRDAR